MSGRRVWRPLANVTAKPAGQFVLDHLLKAVLGAIVAPGIVSRLSR